MMHSPLRYPGGKSDFLAVACEVFTQAGFIGRRIVEPYAGSASISLGLLDFGLTPHVTLLERDPLLYCFWKCVFSHTDELIVRFQDLPITLETWVRFQPLLNIQSPDESKIIECGVAALFLNRANFSGILNAGPIGGKSQNSVYKIDCRTNKDDIISRILALAMLADRVSVLFGDAIDLIIKMKDREDSFFYLDPPYYNKGEMLYRHFYKLKQHKALARALSSVNFSWLLSYDAHHVIEFLYEDFHITRQPFRYSAHSAKNHDELMISNFPLPTLVPLGQIMQRRQRHRPPAPVDERALDLIGA